MLCIKIFLHLTRFSLPQVNWAWDLAVLLRGGYHQSQLLLSFTGSGNALPVMAVSYVPAMVHQPQIASSVVQAVAVYMVAFFALLQPPAQNAFQDLSVQRDAFAAFAASGIKGVVAH